MQEVISYIHKLSIAVFVDVMFLVVLCQQEQAKQKGRNEELRQKSDFCGKLGNFVYDVTNAIINVADLFTDLYILVEFYLRGRYVFFGISLMILVLAQLAYCFAFVVEFCGHKSGGKQVMYFFLILPFAWAASFIFYFTSDHNSRLSRIMERLGFRVFPAPLVDSHAPKLKQFVK
ncbi:hypothetical protein RFI_00421 [Reticulomyxa filosa]|uniref:Uncharacterized protein n=1 Tax=Reticulomyxa filosa TaxID=46433 RepID=X6PEI8_RETFI|nr:hypothetical protein RFI_00421 [Reticulomyxa filosa]|eukprot:ETO36641.1 hypothetical protein RFI_00421 [Reticulomyxa filosa]